MGSSFTKVKDTPNTVVFAEEGEATPNVVGRIYVQRWAWAALGSPERIGVLIASIGDDVPTGGPERGAAVIRLMLADD